MFLSLHHLILFSFHLCINLLCLLTSEHGPKPTWAPLIFLPTSWYLFELWNLSLNTICIILWSLMMRLCANVLWPSPQKCKTPGTIFWHVHCPSQLMFLNSASSTRVKSRVILPIHCAREDGLKSKTHQDDRFPPGVICDVQNWVWEVYLDLYSGKKLIGIAFQIVMTGYDYIFSSKPTSSLTNPCAWKINDTDRERYRQDGVERLWVRYLRLRELDTEEGLMYKQIEKHGTYQAWSIKHEAHSWNQTQVQR